MRRNFRLIVLLLLVFSGVRSLRAEPAASDHAPRLTIATSSGQSIFHVGERIPLVLSFTGPNDKSFAIDLASYDRSGRMYEDTFNVEPHSGWVDPLAAYFRYGAYLGGGLRGGEDLSSKPVTINANLNEWIRFDQPGTYTLTVTSHRVGPNDKRHSGFPHGEIDLVSSNSVKLTIIPATKEWQDETLRRIVHDLPKPGKREDVSRELPTAQENAISDLRFLATTPAVHVLAAQLRDDSVKDWDAYLGLIGLPREEREQALLSMRSLASQPDFPVSSMFLEAMSWVHMPEDQESPPPQERDRKTAERYQQKKLEARDMEWQNILLGLHEKKGAALHATETTLLGTEPDNPDPHSMAVLGTITRASFASMSPADQTRTLEDHWDLIGSRELLPQLREMAKAPPAPADQTNVFFSPRARIAIALRRWYELEPENAAAEAIHQIGQAYPRLYAKEVSYLQDQSFPQFESFWAKTLAEGKDTDDYEPAASLLLHFGTGAVSAGMTEILRHPKDHLGNRLEPALAYLLKFDPGTAEAVLQQKPDLLAGNLDSIAKETSPSAFLTAVALRQLAGSDANRTADALQYLRHYGDERVREPIHKAFLNWYERNKNFADKQDNDLPPNTDAQLNLGNDFFGALLGNQGWIPDAKLTSDVLEHMIGPNKQFWADRASKWNLNVTVSEGDDASYEIGIFDPRSPKLFEEKLDQFPEGTTFTLQHTSCADQHSQNALEASLPELFLKHGLKLIPSN